ncbi:MAG: CocE/NonD family hydrolase [Chitinophagales bacterium]|nr:CocE/NonD family hydrolase [Chitinophagales bacterium]
MRKFSTLVLALLALQFSSKAQITNGQLDDIKEFSTKITVPFVMPDGVKLFTDVYVPRVRDSMVVNLGTFSLAGINLQTLPITFIPNGAQVIFYDSLNGQPNPNPYQLPTIYTRTPYDKGTFDEIGGILPILGYNYMLQDMRGRYSSEGVYFPMYSDSWNKNPYHPFGHVLDYLATTDPKYSNKHEDGYNSVKIITDIDSAYAASVGATDLANLYNGYPHSNTKVNNGTIGMFGASALGNTQLQLALAHRCSDSLPALKCLMPLVATTEHYISTGYNNGVFRDRIVTGWLKGQIFSGTDDDLIPTDNDRQNSIHSSVDYDLPKEITLNGVTKQFQQNKFDAANLSIDHFTAMRYLNNTGVLGNAGFYPNSTGRPDMDGSAAPVDENGEAVNTLDPNAVQTGLPNLTHSRYENQDIPTLHITGWWDIFTEGQINNSNFSRNVLTGFPKLMQKSVIGPWAHQTIASRVSGDRTYPVNVTDLTKIDLSSFDINNVPINEIVRSDLITWFRYNLNYNPDNFIGEPKFIIRESQKWQLLGIDPNPNVDSVFIRVPSEDYVVPFVTMLNFLGGNGTLSNLKIEIKVQGAIIPTTQNVPSVGVGIPQFAGQALTDIPFRDFLNACPNYRYYVPGPDSAADAAAGYPDNAKMGNYWVGSDEFPPTNHIQWQKMFLHQNGAFNSAAPTQDEGYKVYVSDPDDPILTVGGSNMIVRSPDGTRNSQSQMELTDPTNSPYSMDREGVIQFNSDVIADSFTIIGLPVCTLYAKTNPTGVSAGPTDCDWNMRICDVWPDGRVYYVQEGIVGARGRNWARSLVDQMGTAGAPTYANGVEDPGDKDIPYSNINIGEMYEYVFKMMPIGYTFAKGHKIRVLISSSNYTRYQANPQLPLEDGEFFRRKPGDGQFYMFQGQPMFPRVAVQRVHFSPEHPTSINFPVYNSDYQYTAVNPVKVDSKFDISVFPNPASDKIQIFANQEGNHELIITDITGRTVTTTKFDDNVIINTGSYGKGIYFATVTDLNSKVGKVTKKFTIQ